MTIRRQAYDPCLEGDVPLIGVTVTLYDAFDNFVDQTVTDSEGYYTFMGLPLSRYRTEIDYPECGRRQLSAPTAVSDDHAIKFYQNGDLCDIKFSPRSDYGAPVDDDTQFDTLDECCANMFWHDVDGCFSRSRVAFQFEFCLDISGFGEHSNCPLREIRALETAMRKGLGSNSELAILEFGNTLLANIGGETKCIGPTVHEEVFSSSSKLRGLYGSQETKLNICGVVMTKEAGCRNEACLRDLYDKVVGPFQGHFYSGVFASVLHALSKDDLDPSLGLQGVEVVPSSFTTRKLLLPSTVPTDDESLSSDYPVTASDAPRFYPTYISGQLCHSKTLFDSWEQSHGTLKECCEAHFSWDYEACCNSLNMGGC